MKPFTIDLNLDNDSEREQFLQAHPIKTGRRMARQMNFTGSGSAILALCLYDYAWHKAAAVHAREHGIIPTALSYEKTCDNIYRAHIAPVCDCW